MAHVFFSELGGAAAGWTMVALSAPHYRLSARGVAPAVDRSPSSPMVQLRRDGDDWIAFAAADSHARVNGIAVGAAGVRVLRHGDHLLLPSIGVLLYSTESPAFVEAFPGTDRPKCPRCTMAIESDKPAVRCPGCGVYRHEDAVEERLCFTYQGTPCPICQTPPDLDGRLRFDPRQVDR